MAGSFDFFAVNHYTSYICSAGKQVFKNSFEKDMDVTLEVDPDWPCSHANWLKVNIISLHSVLKILV